MPGPAAEGEAAGQGQGPVGVVDGQADLPGGHLHHTGEARVEVDRPEVVGTHPGQLEGGPGGQPDGRRAMEFGAVRNEPVVVGIGARQWEHPSVLGHAGGPRRLHRADDVRRALVDLQVGRAELGIGEGDHAVVRRGRGDLLGAKGPGDPGVGVGCGDLAEAGPQRADARPVLGQCPPVGGAQRVFEERVGLDGQDDPAGDFEIRRPGALGPEQGGRGCSLGRLAGPVHRRFRRVAPCARHGCTSPRPR